MSETPEHEKRSKRVSVSLTPETAARLERFARQHRWTLSTAALALIERGLEEDDTS
jgi:hypothetical protein